MHGTGSLQLGACDSISRHLLHLGLQLVKAKLESNRARMKAAGEVGS